MTNADLKTIAALLDVASFAVDKAAALTATVTTDPESWLDTPSELSQLARMVHTVFADLYHIRREVVPAAAHYLEWHPTEEVADVR